MASLSRDKEGRFRVFWLDQNGNRRSFRLGKISKRNAERFLTYFERLLEAKALGLTPDPETQRWLTEMHPDLLHRLAEAGLAEARQRVQLDQFLKDWMARRSDYGPGTLDAWSRSINDLLAYFGPEKPLADIKITDAEAFRQHLKERRRLSDSTINKRLGHIRGFFKEAVRLKLLEENPFQFVSHRVGTLKRNWRYVSTDEIERVVEYCPNTWWRLIAVLGRYAGFRTPSEHFCLKWSDIHWDAGFLVIDSPKTGLRRCPLFLRVRQALDEAWQHAEEGSDHVFPLSFRKRAMTRFGFRNANLRTTFDKIIRRAGLEPWPNLFHALRKSCETDLVRQFPLPQVAKWLGNSDAIAYRHYIDVTDNALRDAAAWDWGNATQQSVLHGPKNTWEAVCRGGAQGGAEYGGMVKKTEA